MPTDPDHIGMYELLRLIEQANLLGASLSSGGLAVFADVSLETPKLSPPELGCIRVVSWLFVQYFEAGAPGQLQVAKHQQIASRADFVDRRRTVGSFVHGVSRALQRLTQHGAQFGFIFNK